MRQWLIITLLLLLLLAGGFYFFFRLFAPTTAQAFIPVKWQNIPLGQTKTIVHEYLGEPDTVLQGKDHWEQKLNSMKKYVLDVEYKGDTVSANYQITYHINAFGFDQSTAVKSDSLK